MVALPCSGVMAALVTYNPDMRLLREALGSICRQTHTLIVDNGSLNENEISSLCKELACSFVSLGENRGVAAAYNVAFKIAHEAGLSWVITCDQDSIMPDGMVRNFLSEVTHWDGASLGIVCPNFENRTTGKCEYGLDKPTLIDECISSGSMTSIESWEAVGGFDEDMFIDGVDFDFCWRIRQKGYGILLIPSVRINHEIGDARIHSILGHEFLVFNHSAFRKFYIAQNIVYMDGKRHDNRVRLYARLKVLKQELLVLFYESEKCKKLASIHAGVRRGIQLLNTRRWNYNVAPDYAEESKPES